MGRLQPEYYDEVLGSKLKSLVYGAIERSKLEKDGPQTAPSISYENFVQALDAGDSFTTTLVDILVKEYAERKTRFPSIDRHLIAERTSKSLRDLSHIGNAGTAARDVIAQHTDDDDIDVDNNTDDDDDATPIGTQQYNDDDPPYHSLTESISASTASRRLFPVHTTEPATDDDFPPVPLGYRSPATHSPPAENSSSPQQQPSLRRQAHSRRNESGESAGQHGISGHPDQAFQSMTGRSSRIIASVISDFFPTVNSSNMALYQRNEGNERVMARLWHYVNSLVKATERLLEPDITFLTAEERDQLMAAFLKRPIFSIQFLHIINDPLFDAVVLRVWMNDVLRRRD